MENGEKRNRSKLNTYHDLLYYIIYGCFCLFHFKMGFSQTIKHLTHACFEQIVHVYTIC